MRRVFLILIFLLAMCGRLQAGEPRSFGREFLVDSWQTDQGLPQNTITAITQTADGYLWLGTLGGLVRFDGVHFTVFSGEEPRGPSGDRVLCLCPGLDGGLWIGTDGGGLSHLIGGKFLNLSAKTGLLNNRVYSLALAENGDLWIGTEGGLNRWRSGTLRSYVEAGGYPFAPEAALDVRWDHAGFLWVACGDRVARLASGRFTTFLMHEPFGAGSFRHVFQDHSGTVWLGSAGAGLFRIHDGKMMAFNEATGLAGPAVQSIYEEHTGASWVGTGHGLNRYAEGKWTKFTIADGLANNSVRAIFEDREGNLWIGTDGGGLNRLKRRQLAAFTLQDGLTSEGVLALCENSAGGLWVGLNGGGLDRERNGIFTPYSESAQLPTNSAVWSLLSGPDGGLWIGTFGDGLFRVQEGQTARYGSAEGLTSEKILALCEDREGILWVGTYDGLFMLSKAGRAAPANLGPELSGSPVTCILEDRAEGLWFGLASKGLVRLSKGKTTTFSIGDGLGSDSIRALYQDTDGTLWIGTGGGGLTRLREGKFATLSTDQGLLDNVVSQILEDDRGDLWLGANRGIMRLKKSEFEAVAAGRIPAVSGIVYGKEEGMPALECTGGFSPAGLKTRDGRLWFSTVAGLVMVDPARAELNKIRPPIIFEDVVVDGQSFGSLMPAVGASRPRQEGGAAAKVVNPPPFIIEPGRRRIEFHYTALSFVAPEKMRFKYQLARFDPDWINAGSSRSAPYTKVPPGKYWFRVAASNNDGAWYEETCSVAIIILPAFWQKWWFLLTCGVLGVLLITMAARYFLGRRLRRKLQRLEEQHALEKERTRIARDMHDEIGAKLAKISFLSGMAQRDLNYPEKVGPEIERISSTARELLRGLDEIVWAVSPKNDTLENLATYICQYADEFFQKTDIRCYLEIPPRLPHIVLPTDVRNNLFLAVKEALTNVLKHSGADEARIQISLENDILAISVADNGRGMPPSKGVSEACEMRGEWASDANASGLANMRQRIEEIGGRFGLDCPTGRGATVTFLFPLGAGQSGRLARAVTSSGI